MAGPNQHSVTRVVKLPEPEPAPEALAVEGNPTGAPLIAAKPDATP